MDTLFKKSILIFIFFISFFSCFAQDIKPITITGGQLDSLMFDPGSGNLDDDTARIDFSAGDALIFLRKTIETAYWKDTTDLLKESLSRLVYEASNPPFDSTLFYLKSYPFDSISVLWKEYGVPRAITGEEVLNDSVAVPAVVAGDSTLVNVIRCFLLKQILCQKCRQKKVFFLLTIMIIPVLLIQSGQLWNHFLDLLISVIRHLFFLLAGVMK
jgi:hypothetical protein